VSKEKHEKDNGSRKNKKRPAAAKCNNTAVVARPFLLTPRIPTF